MLILVPWKPVVLMWIALSGLVLIGFVGSSLHEGKYPLSMDVGNSPNKVEKSAMHTPLSHEHAQKAASTKN